MNFFSIGSFPKIGKLYTCNYSKPTLRKVFTNPHFFDKVDYSLQLDKSTTVLFLGFVSITESNIALPPTFFSVETVPIFLHGEEYYMWGPTIFNESAKYFFKEVKV